jgi:endonuclease YncB( thermonuclease family)
LGSVSVVLLLRHKEPSMSSRSKRAVTLVLSLLLLLPSLTQVEQFTGKVVGISDGDTLSVLREGKAVKVRLYGIDTPEKGQAFSLLGVAPRWKNHQRWP